MLTRRHLITAGAGLALGGSGLALNSRHGGRRDRFCRPLCAGDAQQRDSRCAAGKKPLIKLSYRPPNYETPIEYFRTAITPTDAFSFRYHLSNIPEVDVRTWKISVGGEGANGEAAFTLDDLSASRQPNWSRSTCVRANRRGLFQPHVPGVEWGYGAMGCARWKGARLKDLLDKVGLKKEAIEIVSTVPIPVSSTRPPISSRASRHEGDRGDDTHRL